MSRNWTGDEIALAKKGVGEQIGLGELGAGEPRSETVHALSAAGVAISGSEKSTRDLKGA
jgi:hypothetical protein